MRTFMLTGVAALALAGCTNTIAANETDAIDNGTANVALADNGAAVADGNTTTLPVSGGAGAQVATADGKQVGTLTVSAADGGLTFTFDARNMAAGTYGVHVHTTGKCEGPKFETAGGHWNPTGKQHGKDNPNGPHYGDLPNLTVSPGGTGSVSFMVAGAALPALLDADGAAFMVHAKADDYKTDPAGAAGDRIACGVIAAR